MMMALGFFSLSVGMVFVGLGFWYPGLRGIGYASMGLFVVFDLVLVVQVLRADHANKKAKNAASAPPPPQA